METSTIHHIIHFKAKPLAVYELIMDAEKHSAFTGGPVIMSKEINGVFEVFEGYCTGYNIELEKGQKIVQAWHFREDGWPDFHNSICTFLFEKEEGGTKMTFTQTDVPVHKQKSLENGWREYYWEPMHVFLNS